jgi:uncharacterized repeat protein (TIGR03847 family)
MGVLIELDPVDRITAEAVGEPGQRTFFLQARKDHRLITLLVEKQQLQLLAASVVEILARVGKETGQGPADESMGLEEPVLAEWRVGRLSIGYQEDRDLLMLEAVELLPELEEPSDDELLQQEEEEAEPEGADEPTPKGVQAALEEQFGVYTVEAILGESTQEEEEEEEVEEEEEPGTSSEDETEERDGHESTAAQPSGGGTEDDAADVEVLAEGREPNRVRFWATREQMLSLARHGAAVCAAGRPRCQLCGAAMDPEGHACPALNGHRPADTT